MATFCLYKISPKNTDLDYLYIGSTQEFDCRLSTHKSCSNNVNDTSSILYKTIRGNGGWDNWKMEVIKIFENKNDMFDAEKDTIIKLKPNLNSVIYKTNNENKLKCQFWKKGK